MKKIFLGFMAVFMMMSSAAIASPFAQKGAELGVTAGAVDSIEGDRIVVKGEGNYQEIELLVDSATHVVQGETGEKLAFAQLKKGDEVTVYYGAAVTRSLPPKGHAAAVVVGGGEDRAMYMKAARVEALAGGDVRVLDTNGDRLVRISRDQVPDIGEIREGCELLVWYRMITMSLPGQAASTKAIVLSGGSDIKVHLHSGVISAQGKELQENMITLDDTVYLPLRDICEALGYEVRWNGQAQSVEVIKGVRSAALSVGSSEYTKMKMRVRLDRQPQLFGGKTFVPVEFFDEVMDLKVEILKNSI